MKPSKHWLERGGNPNVEEYLGAPPNEITEADNELNAVNYGWRITANSRAISADHTYQAALDAILLHEIGHVLGLKDASEAETVMNASQATELEAKDIAQVCRAFPR